MGITVVIIMGNISHHCDVWAVLGHLRTSELLVLSRREELAGCQQQEMDACQSVSDVPTRLPLPGAER